MPHFRSRPTTIEAWQYTGCSGQRGVCTCSPWHTHHLHTMHEGQVVVLEVGDWIVPEPVEHRYYPIKNDVFAKKYEPI